MTHLAPPHGSGKLKIDHAFTIPGACDIHVMKVETGGTMTLVATKSITIAPPTSGAVVGNDPWNPGATALFITGTNATETISVRPQGGNLIVRINGKKIGPKNGFAGINGRIYIYGLAGNDQITVDPLVTNSVVILGGLGNDKISAKNRGNNVLLGQDGNDTITSGSGRDLIVGGLGMDSIKAGDGDDILIAGYTTYDHIFNDDNNADLVSLRKIMAEWTSGNSYDARVAHLTQSGNPLSFNDTTYIRGDVEVFGDNGAPDNLFGEDTNSRRGYHTSNLWIYNYDKGTPSQRDAAKDRTSDQIRIMTT
jgi:Ca2+-binding RTX toxin-like protein